MSKNKLVGKSIFLICPVRNATESQKQRMEQYIKDLELAGAKVHYPARDTNQVDETGFRICSDNCDAVHWSDEVHIFWDKNSTGSLFDLGVAFAYKKPVKIVNIDEIEKTDGKSFTNMILEWNRRCEKRK